MKKYLISDSPKNTFTKNILYQYKNLISISFLRRKINYENVREVKKFGDALKGIVGFDSLIWKEKKTSIFINQFYLYPFKNILKYIYFS